MHTQTQTEYVMSLFFQRPVAVSSEASHSANVNPVQMCWYSVYKCFTCISNRRRDDFLMSYNVTGRQKVAYLHLNTPHSFRETSGTRDLTLEFTQFTMPNVSSHKAHLLSTVGECNAWHAIWLGTKFSKQLKHILHLYSCIKPYNHIFPQTQCSRILSQLMLLPP